MNRKIILFGAFLSTFILILVPNISCVNANILKENNLEIKNTDIDYIKKIKNRILNNDCNCYKTADNINGKSQEPILICGILFGLVIFIGLLMNITYTILGVVAYIFVAMAWGIVLLASIFDCEWYSPLYLNNVFTNNEHFFYNLIKFSYLGLGDVYEK